MSSSSDELKSAGEYLYGRWGWQTKLARRLHVDVRTMRRYIAGDIPMNRTFWEAVKLLVILKSAGITGWEAAKNDESLE